MCAACLPSAPSPFPHWAHCPSSPLVLQTWYLVVLRHPASAEKRLYRCHLLSWARDGCVRGLMGQDAMHFIYDEILFVEQRRVDRHHLVSRRPPPPPKPLCVSLCCHLCKRTVLGVRRPDSALSLRFLFCGFEQVMVLL